MGCKKITDATAANLATYCSRLLHTLDLGNTSLTDAGLAKLGEACSALKRLHLADLPISDSGLCKIAQGCPILEHVDLWGCSNVTETGLVTLAQRCPRLHSLYLNEDVDDQPFLTDEVLSRLRASYPRLTITSMPALETPF